MVSIDKILSDPNITAEAKMKVLENELAMLKVKSAIDDAHNLGKKLKEAIETKNYDDVEQSASEAANTAKKVAEELNDTESLKPDATNNRHKSACFKALLNPSLLKTDKEQIMAHYLEYGKISVLLEECRHYATKIDSVDIDFHTVHSGEIHEFCNALRKLCDEFDAKLSTW